MQAVMAKYYPCYTTSAPVSDHGTYYVCSKEAYDKKNASRNGGSFRICKKARFKSWR